MTWGVSAEPLRFDEAISWFRTRVPLTNDTAGAVDEYARRRAWKVAGVAQLDIVQELHESIAKAVENGTSFDEWKRKQKQLLTSQWGSPSAPRVETIFRNATQQAHNAGRWQQMTEPGVMRLRPYGLFDGVVDSRQSAVCKHWDGTVMLLSDFAAQGAVPQLHHRCRSQIRNITRSEAERRGITAAPPSTQPDEGFGAAPDVAEWHVDPTKYDPGLVGQFERKAEALKQIDVQPLKRQKYRLADVPLGKEPTRPSDAALKIASAEAAKLEAKLTKAEIFAIKDYTEAHHDKIRAIAFKSRSAWEAEFADEDYGKWSTAASTIQRSAERIGGHLEIPKSLYRSIAVDRDVAERILQSDLLVSEAPTSTTVVHAIAAGFSEDAMAGGKVAVQFKLNTENSNLALPIDAVSSIPGEMEVLLGAGKKFRVTNVTRYKFDDQEIVLVDADEVTGALAGGQVHLHLDR